MNEDTVLTTEDVLAKLRKLPNERRLEVIRDINSYERTLQADHTGRIVAKRILEEIGNNFQYYIEGANDGFIFHDDRWQALKAKYLGSE